MQKTFLINYNDSEVLQTITVEGRSIDDCENKAFKWFDENHSMYIYGPYNPELTVIEETD